MSKYEKLWEYVSREGLHELTLTFDDVSRIAGFPLDHSFLSYKKELLQYGYQVKHISLKNKTIEFSKLT